MSKLMIRSMRQGWKWDRVIKQTINRGCWIFKELNLQRKGRKCKERNI